MANTWFVDRDGQERGPFTGQQLKAMATKGEVLPSDLVRRDDTTDWRLASSVKGLFEPVEAPKTTTPPPLPAKEPKGNPQPDRGDNATSVLVNPVVIAVSVLFCFPVGLFLVWRHPTWGKGPKWAWTGAVGVVFTIMMVVGILGRAADQKTLAEADTLWQSGDKAAAVAKYRPILHRLQGSERELAYGRCIDFECEAGNTDGAKQLLAEAAKKQVTPSVNNPQAKGLLAEEKAKIASEQAGKGAGKQSGRVTIKHEGYTQIVMPELPPQRVHDQPEGELEKEIREVSVPDISKVDFLNGPNGEPIEMDRFYDEGATRYVRSYGYFYRNKSGKKVYHGPWYSFNLPNKKTSESIYVHGALKTSNDWDHTGNPLSLMIFKSDEDNSQAVYQYYDSGGYRFHGQFVKVRFVPTNSGHRIERVPDGLHFYYWEQNGKVRQEEVYENGRQTGIAIYDLSGRRVSGRGVLGK